MNRFPPHMNARFLPLLLITALLGLVSVRADDQPKAVATQPPSEAELRATITKGLGFLAKDGEAWMEQKDCNSCHHLPEMLWSHRVAKLRGFEIDQKKFDEWLAWADKRAKEKGPGLEMLAFMKLAMPERPSPELTKIITADQKPDGSWNPGGQFTSQRRGNFDAQATSARIFLLALATPDAAAPEADAARTKAAAFLAKKDAPGSPGSLESLVVRMIYARSTGNTADADALRGQILKQAAWRWRVEFHHRRKHERRARDR